MNHCIRHFEEPIASYCRSCERPFCRRCLVFPFGPDKPGYCVGCALAEAGVRQSARGQNLSAPPADRKVIKAQRKAERDAQKQERRLARATARADKKAAPEPAELGTLPPPPSATVPAPSTLPGETAGSATQAGAA